MCYIKVEITHIGMVTHWHLLEGRQANKLE